MRLFLSRKLIFSGLIRLEKGQRALDKQATDLDAAIRQQVDQLSRKIEDSRKEAQQTLEATGARAKSIHQLLTNRHHITAGLVWWSFILCAAPNEARKRTFGTRHQARSTGRKRRGVAKRRASESVSTGPKPSSRWPFARMRRTVVWRDATESVFPSASLTLYFNL